MAQVAWTLDARTDLLSIGAYIRQDSPEYAELFVARVARATRRLRRFPEMGRVVPEYEDESLRELIFQNYRIVYRHAGDRVGILAVVHAAMDLESLGGRQSWLLS